MDNYAAEAYFYADRLSEKLKGGSPKKNKSKMFIAYSKVIEYANVVQSLGKSSRSLARAQYHMRVAEYILGNSKSQQVQKLKKLLKKNKLPKSLAKRAKFLISLESLSDGNLKSKSSITAAADLEELKSSLSVSGGITAKLALGRYYAAINGKGKKIGTVQKKYKNYLFAASDKTFEVGKKLKKKVLQFILGVWRTADGRKASWKRPPFNEDRFTAQEELLAITERDGIWEWQKGDKRKAISIQKKIALKIRSNPISTDFDSRALDMEEFLFSISGKYRTYEKLIISTRKRYENPEKLGRKLDTGAKKMVSNLLQRHKSLVFQNLKIAENPSIPAGNRRNAIKLAQRFLNLSSKKLVAKNEPIEVKIAQLWVLNNQHSKAVEIYLRIVKTTINKNKIPLLNAAIRSQRIVAQWPSQTPWNQIKFAMSLKSSRTVLLKIFHDLNARIAPKIDWNVTGQIGQLHLSLNQQKSAFKIWESALRKSPKGRIPALAAGTMLHSYLKTQRWQNLEDLARFSLSAKISPIHKSRALIPMTLLPLALLKGGGVAMQQKNFGMAVKKLYEFSYKFKAKDHDFGFMTLAYAYKSDQQHRKSIDTLIAFTQRFPRTRYFKKILLKGAEWSVPLAFEENAMFFFNEFLKYFPGSREAPEVTKNLIKLYLGRRLYSEAGKILGMIASSTSTSASNRISAQIQKMRVEAKFGASEKALAQANQLIGSAPNIAIKAEALVVKAKQLYSIRDSKGLAQLSQTIERLTPQALVSDYSGHVRYLRAEANLGPMLKSVNSHLIENPLQAVFDRYNLFLRAYVDFSKVCAVGRTSYCAPSLHRIARLASRMIDLIQGFRIPATLEEKVISDFIKKKDGLLSNLKKVRVESDKKALRLTVQGFSPPNWVQQILWLNSNDWNFSNITGEAGNGFLQWNLSDKK